MTTADEHDLHGASIFIDGGGTVVLLPAGLTRGEALFLARNACARAAGDATDPAFDALVEFARERGIELFEEEGGSP
jgi:hypothetical protein